MAAVSPDRGDTSVSLALLNGIARGGLQTLCRLPAVGAVNALEGRFFVNQDQELLYGRAASRCLAEIDAIRVRAERSFWYADQVRTWELDALAVVLRDLARERIPGSPAPDVDVNQWLQDYVDLAEFARAATRARIAGHPSSWYDEVAAAAARQSTLAPWILEAAATLSESARAYLTCAVSLEWLLDKGVYRALQARLREGLETLEEPAARALAPIAFERAAFGRAVYYRTSDLQDALRCDEIWLGYAQWLHGASRSELRAIAGGDLLARIHAWISGSDWLRQAVRGLDGDDALTLAALCEAILAQRPDLARLVFHYPALVSLTPAAVGLWALHQPGEAVADLLALLPPPSRRRAHDYIWAAVSEPGLLEHEWTGLVNGRVLRQIRRYYRWRWIPAPVRAFLRRFTTPRRNHRHEDLDA